MAVAFKLGRGAKVEPLLGHRPHIPYVLSELATAIDKALLSQESHEDYQWLVLWSEAEP